MSIDGRPGILLILDGWGHADAGPANALTIADTPTLDRLRAQHPNTVVEASGEAVGLLAGTVGNSEIGHLVIGAGRPLPYDSLLVAQAISSGALRADPVLNEVCADLTDAGRALHLVGLCSDGQIHAHVEHLAELLTVAAAHRVQQVYIHAFTDGRDVADGTAAAYLARVQDLAAAAGVGQLTTVTGRAYGLDKAGNTALTAAAAHVIADGTGRAVDTAADAVAASERGDQWVPPSVVDGVDGRVVDGDVVLFFHFRSDRIQQLADYLLGHLSDTARTVRAVSLAQYDTTIPITALVGRADATGGLADELARRGLRSVRIAEAEKFEHVTFYLNGRDATERVGEEHIRIDTGQQPDYVTRPQMNLDRVTDAILAAAKRPEVDLVVANLANIDVVGHTGDLDATVAAAEHTDAAVSRILAGAGEAGRWVLLVGDHGNAEVMTKTGPDGTTRPYGGHTLHPVPVVVVPAAGQPLTGGLTGGGSLADIAPTVLHLLGYPPATAMTGRSLL